MRIRVTIIYNMPLTGGYYPEHETAAVTGVMDAVAAVRTALIELGYDVTCMPLTPPLEMAKGRLIKLHTDLVFNLF